MANKVEYVYQIVSIVTGETIAIRLPGFCDTSTGKFPTKGLCQAILRLSIKEYNRRLSNGSSTGSEFTNGQRMHLNEFHILKVKEV